MLHAPKLQYIVLSLILFQVVPCNFLVIINFESDLGVGMLTIKCIAPNFCLHLFLSTVLKQTKNINKTN